MAEPKRLYRRLDSLCFPPLVEEAVMDASGQPREKLESSYRPAWKEQFPSPAANRVDRIALMAFDIRGELPQLIDAVFDAEGPSGVFETEAVTG